MRRTLLSLGFAIGLVGLVTARDVDPELTEKALALNSITQKEATAKKLRELFRDKVGTKKLLTAALS